jgi:hypothetical protein
VTGLLLAVIAVDLSEERVRVRVVAGQLLEQVGDLLAGEDQDDEEGGAVEDRADDEPLDHSERAPVEGAGATRLELVEDTDEQPRVAGLLPQLVQQVLDALVRQVGRVRHLQAEAGQENRLEAEPLLDDGGDLLSRQAGALFGRELPGQREARDA